MPRRDNAVITLFEEFRFIRKGHGIHGVDRIGRAGPAIRRICGVTGDDSLLDTRKKIINRLDQLTRQLDDPHRRIARIAFGFDCEPGTRYLDRLGASEQLFDRGLRSLQRRCDEALRLLAEATVAEDNSGWSATEDSPWQTKTLHAVVVLDDDGGADVTEVRKIVSNRDALAEIEHSVTVPPLCPGGRLLPASLGLRMDFGAEVVKVRTVTTGRVIVRLRMTRVLHLGETHEFGFRLNLPSIAPFYFCTPIHRCDSFKLEVRLGASRPAGDIQVIDGAMAHEATDPAAASELIAADRFGLVSREFHTLRPGFSYGLTWPTAHKQRSAA